MVVIVEPKPEAGRSIEERHGLAGAIRALGSWGGHVAIAPLAAAMRTVSPAVAKALAAWTRSVTAATRGVGKHVR